MSPGVLANAAHEDLRFSIGGMSCASRVSRVMAVDKAAARTWPCAAGVTLMRPDPRLVAYAIDISRRNRLEHPAAPALEGGHPGVTSTW